MLCVGLGFHVVTGVVRLIVRFHHAYVIPSFLLDVVIRFYLVIVNSDCSHNYCLLHIAKTGSLRCGPYTRKGGGVLVFGFFHSEGAVLVFGFLHSEGVGSFVLWFASLCRHLTPQITPAFVDPASSHMLVLYTCTAHNLDCCVWLKTMRKSSRHQTVVIQVSFTIDFRHSRKGWFWFWFPSLGRVAFGFGFLL